MLTRLAAVPLIVIMIVAIVSTKIPILLGHDFWIFYVPKMPRYGFWSMMHEARADLCMLLGSLYLLDRGRRKMVAGRAAEPKSFAFAGGMKRTKAGRPTWLRTNASQAISARAPPFEVLRVFFKLGVSSFGGPIAHIGYFREEFVVRRRWLDEQAFVDLVALCQFLPGPASSQTGFSIGLIRAGYAGALAAWTGFTLPSAIVMVLFAYGAGALGGPARHRLLHGLKLVAVAIVAQAVWGMARTLCPDRQRASIAALSALIILFSTSSIAQIGAIALGGVLACGSAAARRRRRKGTFICRSRAAPDSSR